MRRWFARQDRFHCPVCDTRGPFRDVTPATGRRRHAQCPRCGSLERHRLQFLVLERVFASLPVAGMSLLHVAPEAFFRDRLRTRFGGYVTADRDRTDVDHRVDLQSLPFPDGSFDFVFASHVLEHVPDDRRALGELRRILRPGGVAVLPVPIVAPVTVEYPEPNPHEHMHVRAPGLDYFDRYAGFFARVERFGSESFPAGHQLYIYEDRTRFPTRECPLRPAMPGERHADVVPVCYV